MSSRLSTVSMYMLITFFVCISFLATHAGSNHPIGKLITGTYLIASPSFDGSYLYVCKATRGRYYWTLIRAHTDPFSNYLQGNGVFTKSDIDYDAAVISNQQCFYQENGHAQEMSACFFDVTDLCVKERIFLDLIDVQQHRIEFLKLSNNIVGNLHLEPYQCGIPWDGDLSQEDSYPLSFLSGVHPWMAAGGGREVQVFVDDFTGCWQYMQPDGVTPTPNYGEFDNQLLIWDDKYYIDRFTDATLPDDNPCKHGSQISIRVDQNVVLLGWQCEDGVSGTGYLTYKIQQGQYDACPVFG